MKLTPLQHKILRFFREEKFSIAPVIQHLVKHKSVQATHQALNRMCSLGLVDKANINIPVGPSIKVYGITFIRHVCSGDQSGTASDK